MGLGARGVGRGGGFGGGVEGGQGGEGGYVACGMPHDRSLSALAYASLVCLFTPQLLWIMQGKHLLQVSTRFYHSYINRSMPVHLPNLHWVAHKLSPVSWCNAT